MHLVKQSGTEQSCQSFDLAEAIAVLERTPAVLSALLCNLPETLIRATEGAGTWSPYDVVGHLIHGELTDWIPRAQQILSGKTEPFERFDRNAQFAVSAGKTLSDLLEEFAKLRTKNLATLKGLNLKAEDFARTGLHPELGSVTLGQLLATWVVHDLDHIGQIARVLAKYHANNVGPWTAYLSILTDRRQK
ncbi:MAG TPA: DinB family protein [Pyrinomonadaceae bacterium]|nr:DinB family protein [Pyrinomonadaceae bacterium]